MLCLCAYYDLYDELFQVELVNFAAEIYKNDGPLATTTYWVQLFGIGKGLSIFIGFNFC